MTIYRFDVISRAGGWTVALGGPTGISRSSRREALAEATRSAREVVARGDTAQVYIWDGEVAAKVVA
jgi:hypothetical protein